jgi:DNA mismatch repair protein MutS
VERDSISLLYPVGPRAENRGLEERSTVDLDLYATIVALCENPDQQGAVRKILEALCQDADTIRYRQEVLADLLADEDLAAGLEALVPDISTLSRYHLPREKAELLYEVTWRLGELESYCDCVDRLADLFGSPGRNIHSRALGRLYAYVQAVTEDLVFKNLRTELPELMSRVRGIASVTVGINLDRDLQPRAATLLRINKKRFHGSSDTLLGRLFGGKQTGEWEGIAPLHSMPKAGGAEERSSYVRPLMVPLFRDLSDLLGRSCRPIAAALERYVRINSRILAETSEELTFYLGARRLIRRVQSWGLPLCRPEIAPAEEGACVLKDGYNLNLALRFAAQDAADLGERIVRNDFEIGNIGDVFVLTGPNRGGKTTYMQAVGLAQVLAQAGLHVPAQSARISPVDGIFTHFPAKEHPELDTGRLGEEAQRLRELFAEATPGSLILLNESLSTTTPAESLVLARDVLRILRLLGARAVYTTHLHELAREVGQLNAESPGTGRIASLVSLVEDGQGDREAAGSAAVNSTGSAEPPPSVRRTFKIRPGAPAGYSYAREIAAKHGVSYRQLEQLLRGRGLIS